MQYSINVHRVPDISIAEIQPVSVTQRTFTAEEITATLIVEWAKRFDLSDPDDTGDDVATLVSIPNASAVVTVADLWKSGEAREAGQYVLKFLVKNQGATRKEETNLIYQVV